MQEDMHYYGTYAMARAAGLVVKDAKVIAYAAQYVDDSVATDSEQHDDGGMFEATASAHTTKQEIRTSLLKRFLSLFPTGEKNASLNSEQRKVWVPFHFFPGAEGDTLSEKLKCVKDSQLARAMVKNHIRHAVAETDKGGLELMGVMAHVYADTFSHYGFSGVSSRGNDVNGDSFELKVINPEMKQYLLARYDGFQKKYVNRYRVKNWRKISSEVAKANKQALGHGAVGTYPDRPFLKWKFTYEDGSNLGWRDNQATFLEGCEKIHKAFSDYAVQAGKSFNPVDFSTIKDKVAAILAIEAAKDGRIEAWKEAIKNNELFEADDNEALIYSSDEWEQQKENFEDLSNSSEMIDTNVYRFHQAAIYHRNYTLKQLLPKHRIMVL